MNVHLSLYWQTADQLEWYWSGEDHVASGSLEELQSQKQQRNLNECTARLFLPETWFSTLDLKLPAKARSLSSQALKFAAEEHLAQDIDSVHLVMRSRPKDGSATVIVTELERFKTVLKTLKTRGFNIIEAYNEKDFSGVDGQTDDIVIQVSALKVSLWFGQNVYTVHPKGFSQWFALWVTQNEVPADATIQLLSESADGDAKSIATELEVSGYTINWHVQQPKQLIDWHERASSHKPVGNLITNGFSNKSKNAETRYWLPTATAAILAVAVWSAMTLINQSQLNKQIEQAWAASENVFLQVFGNDKRIQRPLMVREMRGLITDTGSTEQKVNALRFLNDLNIAQQSLIMEDFRFNRERSEAFFTLVQASTDQADAFDLFETLKTELGRKGYVVEYSANQDNDGYRARFKSVFGGQS